ncbi:hypothetical protein JQ557_16795 [Bradyrhizobium sp. U87765 SZCCT0131]|uniref:hypothetical protein n=1 Tax=unclassified Bradyrhizobium TaxID=2631580 RepID=UPI001BAA6610|nr:MULTISPECIES: hypothetical protein [unclassified Bradyrhizobium]MBR1219667.1 hypothetical protein [Bradyrhizobium sp. U87765 SZCCT0131]MBR1262318.1 hypothetical protein [Bradyrhizobium sp. U87765 SZCCT0134]MBR1308499.1 hypothetical protein [Bradyrhizobium sp. U87765 SZCCT0110]MBR1318100.1 hypothetical protein [Bradyrhizobium sp. U87765 SZCCT0109]MBR1351803.1 hypothetical protein [Bradyrhizobium sp. U87765 SZCCT0048]
MSSISNPAPKRGEFLRRPGMWISLAVAAAAMLYWCGEALLDSVKIVLAHAEFH